MTTPPSFPTLPGQGWSIHKRPAFATIVASHVSGREVRDALYQNPIWQFELTFDGLASDSASYPGLGAQSLQSLMGLFLQCQGQFGTFLYTDPTDNRRRRSEFRHRRRFDDELHLCARARRLSRAGRLGDERFAGHRRRRRAEFGLAARHAEQLGFHDCTRERRADRRVVRLRLPVPLRRRRRGFRAVHAEPVDAAEPEIPIGAN